MYRARRPGREEPAQGWHTRASGHQGQGRGTRREAGSPKGSPEGRGEAASRLQPLEAGSWSGSLALPAGSPVPEGDEGEGSIKTEQIVIKRTVLYNSGYETCG